jgi:hypothetical protein
MNTTTLYLVFAGLLIGFLSPVSVSASSAISTKEARQGIFQKLKDQYVGQEATTFSEQGSVSKIQKAKLFVKKRFAGDKVDFQTEPDRWMWYWLAGWAIGLALTIVGIPLAGTVGLLLTSIAGLFWAAGSICGIIWLLKISGAI